MGADYTGLNVLCAVPMDKGQRARLEREVAGCAVVYADADGVADGEIAAADVILGNVAADRIGASPRLKLMQLNSAGADAYVAPGVLAPGTVLACARGAYGQAVSEHALALLLCLMKKLYRYRDSQGAAAWEDAGAVASPEGTRVLVLGAGDIGSAFARLARGVGAHVTGVKRNTAVLPDGFDAVAAMDDLPGLLPQADAVVSFLPGGPATDGLADAAFFARMRPSAYFVNAGRGGLVDQGALLAALEEGRIAGAALDVTSPEPLPAESPLWRAPNLVITPHVAGGYHLPQTLRRVVDICIANAGRLVRGEEVANVVAHA